MGSGCYWVSFGMVAVLLGAGSALFGQTASTGAVIGATFDPSGSVLPGVSVGLSTHDGLDTKSSLSDENGTFVFPSVPPGTYDLEATKIGFQPLNISNFHVDVTETVRLELHLAIASHVERMHVSSDMLMVQVDDSALGRVVNTEAINDLPLVNRNFTQITSLSPLATPP
jgi:hypothetical protein